MSMFVWFNLHEEKMNVLAVPLMLLIFTMVESGIEKYTKIHS